MEIDIQTIFRHFRHKIDSVLATMHDEHEQKGLLIRRDTEPVSLPELQYRVSLQLEEIRHREEVAAAIQAKYHLDMQHRVRLRQSQLLHDSTQRAVQNALAAVLDEPTPPHPADVPTVCLNDVVAQSLTPRTSTEGMTALEYMEQGGLEETLPRQPAITPPIPEEWSPLRQRAPSPEELQPPQEQSEPLHWRCQRARGESLQNCFERCRAEYSEMYNSPPKCIYVSPDNNMTLSFFTLSLPRREQEKLEDGSMVAEG